MKTHAHWLVPALALGLGGCAAELEGDPTRFDVVRNANIEEPSLCDVGALIKTSCAGIGCHGASVSAAGLDLESPNVEARILNVPATHQDILDGSQAQCATGELLVDGSNPDNSLILRKVLGTHSCGAKMPIARTLSSQQIECLREWVFRVADGT